LPEGPEIHSQARKLARLLEGSRPEIECPWPALGPQMLALQGQRVERCWAQGKAFLCRFEGGLTLYAHMQLYGRWQLGKPRPTRRQLRLRLGEARLYSATDLALLDAGGVAQHPYLSKLGPDLLDPQVGWEQVLGQLRHPRFQRRALAQLFLDQHFLAGPGNYLRSEILFAAGLKPDLRPQDLSLLQGEQLSRLALGLTRRALETGGVTTPEHLVKREKSSGTPRRWYRHWVFGREGKGCWLCQAPIVRETWAGRRLYRCLQCVGEREQVWDSLPDWTKSDPGTAKSSRAGRSKTEASRPKKGIPKSH
jgi:endonuclease-8